MSKVYLIAVNTEKRNNDKNTTTSWLREIDVCEGDDMAGWVTSFPYNENWRIYAFTVKGERDAHVKKMIDYWRENIAEN